MLGLARRRPQPRHPTPQQAFAALSDGHCLYAQTGSACSGGMRSAGLRTNDDNSAVLVCRAHYGRLRQLDGRELDQLEQHLLRAFLTAPPAAPAPAQDEGPRVVLVKRHTPTLT